MLNYFPVRNLRLSIQYAGTRYNGWQIQKSVKGQESGVKSQKNVITIQGVIQEAIKKITGENIRVIGAGRTDAGVHAIRQVASFKTSSKLSADVIKRALNANLPHDIRILEICPAESSFHPRFDAKSKVYSYVISNSQTLSPFLSSYAWAIPQPLYLDDMEKALNSLKGTRDFSALRASGCSSKNPIRTIFFASIEESDSVPFICTQLSGSFIKICIEADAFLRYMVRNIVGTIVEVGKGKIKADDINRIMLSGDRRLAGPTAPARGLFLEKINY